MLAVHEAEQGSQGQAARQPPASDVHHGVSAPSTLRAGPDPSGLMLNQCEEISREAEVSGSGPWGQADA